MSATRRHVWSSGRNRAREALAVVLAGLIGPLLSFSVPAEPVVTDTRNGLAISGFDPVAYFTDAAPGLGSPQLEYRNSGAVWRFRNQGNRAAFAEHPEVYAPQFGGYDPVAIGRGRSVPGHPLIWTVTGQRLYLFYSAEARRDFLAGPQRVIAEADRKWQAVQKTLP